MNRWLFSGACLFVICQSSLVKSEVECIDQPNSTEPICFDLGGKKKPVVIKPGKQCGTSSSCGGSSAVAPQVSTNGIEGNTKLSKDLKGQLNSKPSANPALQGKLRQ
ncbi:hypothetical protein [Candidatus Nitrotoga sp. BS]|uniref:hypothetical protein n=1 Tax=Candidatus Nitrotoga sp. BS TaxID=2890408 RepID=UPI001EF3869F|nr:hypothetical protein [Candidatus Nitrotoga sp. BS]